MVNALDSVTFDDSGLQNQGDGDNARRWNTADGDIIDLYYYALAPDILADLNSLREVRDFYRTHVTPGGVGVVEIDTFEVEGCQAVRTIFKASQDPVGTSYVGGITLPFRDFSYVVRVQCNERGISGLREYAVFQELTESGEVYMDEDGNVMGWSQDPYDPAATAALLRNRSEDEKYDEEFPDHPLSRLRRILRQIQESLRVADDVKAKPSF